MWMNLFLKWKLLNFNELKNHGKICHLTVLHLLSSHLTHFWEKWDWADRSLNQSEDSICQILCQILFLSESSLSSPKLYQMAEPCSNLAQISLKPHSNLAQTSLKPYSNFAQTLLKLHSKFAQISLKSRSNLTQTSLKPHSHLAQTSLSEVRFEQA